jgi:hypothetical protein
MAESGMLPPGEAFDARQLTGAQFNHRLVVDADTYGVGQGGAQLGNQLATSRYACLCLKRE